MAIAARILVKIVLMVLLRRPEAGQRKKFHIEGTVPPALQVKESLDDREVFRVLVVYARLVLRSDISALPV